jgi:hypothetical protein
MFRSPRALLQQKTDVNPAVFTLDSKMDLKRLTGASIQQISLERKKDPEGSLFLSPQQSFECRSAIFGAGNETNIRSLTI